MDLKNILTPPKTVAVVGLSDNPQRDSYEVATYLKEHGFIVIPVNPMIKKWGSLDSFPSLAEIPKDIHIDVVDIFRRPEVVPDIVREVIDLGIKPAIWMQEGVISEEAKKLAEDQGMEVVMDECMMKKHKNYESKKG